MRRSAFVPDVNLTCLAAVLLKDVTRKDLVLRAAEFMQRYLLYSASLSSHLALLSTER